MGKRRAETWTAAYFSLRYGTQWVRPESSGQKCTVGRSFNVGRYIVIGWPNGGRIALTLVFAACLLVSLVANRLGHVVRADDRRLCGRLIRSKAQR
jgi:hypothetical protein